MEVLPTSNSAPTGESEPESNDRRMQPRFECDGFAEVVVDNAGFLFRGKIRDFSLSGCYICSLAPLNLERGTEVELRFAVAGDYVSTAARIVVVRPGAGAGFAFLAKDPELQDKLARLIRKHDETTNGRESKANADADPGSQAGIARNLW